MSAPAVSASAPLTADEARVLVDRLNASIAEVVDLVGRLYVGRAWVALGYGSWDELCQTEVRVPRLDRDERTELVVELRSAGLSTRAIGSAVGIGDATVRRDLATASDDAVAPEAITGLDGSTRSAHSADRHRREVRSLRAECDRFHDLTYSEWTDEDLERLAAAIRRAARLDLQLRLWAKVVQQTMHGPDGPRRLHLRWHLEPLIKRCGEILGDQRRHTLRRSVATLREIHQGLYDPQVDTGASLTLRDLHLATFGPLYDASRIVESMAVDDDDETEARARGLLDEAWMMHAACCALVVAADPETHGNDLDPARLASVLEWARDLEAELDRRAASR